MNDRIRYGTQRLPYYASRCRPDICQPGSTEISFLTDLPDDLEFVLGLHEGSVVGMATGHAIATGRPAFVVNLHTTAGLGNAVGALATARVNRAPLVVVVGQQDRNHLSLEPFLAGQLAGLAGSYPVWTNEPVLPADVPGAIRRPAMRPRSIGVRPWWSSRWTTGSLKSTPARDQVSPLALVRAGSDPAPVLDDLAAVIGQARASGDRRWAGSADQASWDGLVRLAERLGVQVWQGSLRRLRGLSQIIRTLPGTCHRTDRPCARRYATTI